MPISEVLTPNKNISGYDSEAASTTQLRYEFTREDWESEAANAATDTITFLQADGDVTAEFPPGSKLWYEDALTPINTGLYTVLSSTYPVSLRTAVVVVEGITSNSNQGIVNALSRTNYVLQVEIPELPGITNFYIPKINGTINFDMGKTIQWALGSTVQYIWYKLEYTEIWEGSNESPISSDQTLAVISKRQIMAVNGSNLFDYILKAATPLPLPLTVFEEAKKWLGWTMKLYFINMDYSDIDTFEILMDINKDFFIPPSSVTTNITPTPPLIISHEMSEPADASAGFIKFHLQDGVGSSGISAGYFIKLEEPCRNPIMIEWLNKLGGFDTWLFQYEQNVLNIIEEGYKFQGPIVGDIEDSRGNKGRFAERNIQYLTLKADHLTADQIKNLHDIKESQQVKAWLNMDGSEWVNVIVDKGYSTDYTTGKSGYQFTLSIEMPDNFDFFTAKLY